MTETIQQMADNVFNKDTYECDCTKMLVNMMKDSFINGGYAVLEEIGKCYEKDDSLCVISHKIISKIQQLKGE